LCLAATLVALLLILCRYSQCPLMHQ